MFVFFNFFFGILKKNFLYSKVNFQLWCAAAIFGVEIGMKIHFTVVCFIILSLFLYAYVFFFGLMNFDPLKITLKMTIHGPFKHSTIFYSIF